MRANQMQFYNRICKCKIAAFILHFCASGITYLVVNASSAYNMLLGRPTLNRLGAVPSTRHMKMKLSDLTGKVITIKSDQKEAKRCYENNLKTR